MGVCPYFPGMAFLHLYLRKEFQGFKNRYRRFTKGNIKFLLQRNFRVVKKMRYEKMDTRYN